MPVRDLEPRRKAEDEPAQLVRSFLDTITSDLELSETLRIALEHCCRLLGLDAGWLYLLDEDTQEPELVASRQMPETFATQPERWEGLCGCVHALYQNDEKPFEPTPELYRCSRLQGVEQDNPQELKYHVCIPLFLRNRPIGIVNVARSDWLPVPAPIAAALRELGQLLCLAVERDRLLKSKPATKAERERIARELHDTLLQGLTGIALQLETADALIDAGAKSRNPLLRALQLTQETMAETRAAIDDLGAVSLGSDTLATVLTRLMDDFEQQTGTTTSTELDLGVRRLPSSVETAVVRIVREGLQNVVRHAGARSVQLRARNARGRLSVILVDDGRGFDAANVAASFHGYGLASMRRRVQLLGGYFRLRTAPGKGTRVEISIPVAQDP